MQKKFQALSFSAILFLFIIIFQGTLSGQIQDQIKALPNVVSVEKLETGGMFKEKYLVLFEQPIDHKQPEYGSFEQYVYVSHLDIERPVVFVTEGYAANYAERPAYTNELSAMLETNQIVVEHRYFNESGPIKPEWEYLTVENAAADHHAIVESLKNIYHGKWISTGISKGGQTCLFHRSMYPEDVDISVPYVAPLNFGAEDGRHEIFLNNVARKKDREKILSFQKTLLKGKSDELMSLFDLYRMKQGFKFQIPLEEVFDFCVLEYSFAFWQWGTPLDQIPDEGASQQEIFKHFMQVSAPDYFANPSTSPILPFFMQAQYQLGYYGYETTPFKDWLSIESAEGYLQQVFIPEGLEMEYDGTRMLKVQEFIENEDPKMIFIYGEYDPWSATAVDFGKKKNMKKVVKKKGSHTTRIHNLPNRQKKKVLRTLNKWLEE